MFWKEMESTNASLVINSISYPPQNERVRMGFYYGQQQHQFVPYMETYARRTRLSMFKTLQVDRDGFFFLVVSPRSKFLGMRGEDGMEGENIWIEGGMGVFNLC